MLKPILPRVLPSILNRMNQHASVQVFALSFDGLAQYVQFSQPVVIPENTDFEIEVCVSGVRTDAFQSIFSGPTINDFFRALTNGDGIQVYAGGYVVSWTGANLNVSETHVYGLRRVGVTISIIIDGVVVSTRNGSSSQVVIDRLMRSWGTSSYSLGVPRLFKAWVNGDKNSGQLVLDLPLTKREMGAIQYANSPSNFTAEIINYTDAMWAGI